MTGHKLIGNSRFLQFRSGRGQIKSSIAVDLIGIGKTTHRKDGGFKKSYCTIIDRPVKSLKLLFEFRSTLGKYMIVYFYGLFWGEQQPFVSSGYGGLYFLRTRHAMRIYSRFLSHSLRSSRSRYTPKSTDSNFEFEPDDLRE